MQCENCSCNHNGSYGSGRFCSCKCARGFATKTKRTEINEKVRQALKKEPRKALCVWCKKQFILRKKTQKCCSIRCGRLNYYSKPENRERAREIAKKLVESGRHLGWRKRKKGNPSYPEQYFMNFFDNYEINYEYEYRVGRYSVDFMLGDKIAFEVDGKQHKMPDRMIHDKKRDVVLENDGWTVYRLPWKGPGTKKGRIHMDQELEKLRAFLNEKLGVVFNGSTGRSGRSGVGSNPAA